jgi:hypothetical protein
MRIPAMLQLLELGAVHVGCRDPAGRETTAKQNHVGRIALVLMAA